MCTWSLWDFRDSRPRRATTCAISWLDRRIFVYCSCEICSACADDTVRVCFWPRSSRTVDIRVWFCQDWCVFVACATFPRRFRAFWAVFLCRVHICWTLCQRTRSTLWFVFRALRVCRPSCWTCCVRWRPSCSTSSVDWPRSLVAPI